MTRPHTLASNLVLSYWNKLLLEKGIITRKEYLQMAEKILRKYPAFLQTLQAEIRNYTP